MNKGKIQKLVVAILVLVLLWTGFSLVSCEDTQPQQNEDTNFICYHNHHSDIAPKNAQEIIAEFADENNMTVDQWPQEIVEMLEKNPETEEFVLNYPMMKDVYQDIDISDSVGTGSVPLFIQWDQRWGYTPYGEDCIAISGCGPTCLSMVCVYLLGDTSLDPRTVAQFAENNGYCVPGNGSTWTLISEGGEVLGLNVEELPLYESYVVSSLEEGKPVICIMGEGDFTTSGHYIVMTDYIDGMIKINDPNSKENSEKLWNFDDIKDQINNLWACSI